MQRFLSGERCIENIMNARKSYNEHLGYRILDICTYNYLLYTYFQPFVHRHNRRQAKKVLSLY